MKDNSSGFRRIAIGVATEHLEPKSQYLVVHILELVSNTDVVYSDKNKKETSTSVTDTFTSKLKRESTLKCRYYNKGSNTISAPTVRRGETIEVYQYADTDQYFWRPAFYESDIRGQEVQIIQWSNIPRAKDPKKHLEKLTKDNSYWFKADTINKKFHFRANKNDGEPTDWDIKLDSKIGRLSINNGSGDSLEIAIGKIKGKTKVFEIEADTILLNGKSLIKLITNSFSLKASLAKIAGGALEVLSSLTQKGSSNFKAGVRMNKNASTTDGSKVN